MVQYVPNVTVKSEITRNSFHYLEIFKDRNKEEKAPKQNLNYHNYREI